MLSIDPWKTKNGGQLSRVPVRSPRKAGSMILRGDGLMCTHLGLPGFTVFIRSPCAELADQVL
jgi:hypothetical protein